MASGFEADISRERERRNAEAKEQQRKQAAYGLIKQGLVDELIRRAGSFRDMMVGHGIRPQQLHVEVPPRGQNGPWTTVDTGHRGWRPLVPAVEYHSDETRPVVSAGLFVTTTGHLVPVNSAAPPIETAMRTPAVVYRLACDVLETASFGRRRLRPLSDIQRDYLDGHARPQPIQPGTDMFAEDTDCYLQAGWGDTMAQLTQSAATWLEQSGK